MSTIDIIKQRYQQVQSNNGSSVLTPLEQKAFNTFNQMGIPTVRHEEWKYTRIGSVLNKELAFTPANLSTYYTTADLDAVRLPGHEEANELVFINGIYSPTLSTIRSASLIVLPLEEAAHSGHQGFVMKHLGHSSQYIKDGIHAMNTAFAQEGVFIQAKRGKVIEHPVYFYHITDARSASILAQPRSLVQVCPGAQIQLVENYTTLGMADSFTNQVMEIIVEKDAIVEYYKIQADTANTSQVSTTHFRQIEKSYVHAVTISLDGGIVRNNLNMVMEAEHSESHMYGLYFLKGNTHVDNHTIVDNVMPHCESNELYKGIIDDNGTAVFNGKIFVQKDAQKTNAFQSNKNILLSENASVNTKPQLEIFADDVKCSHGCTIGQLD
ncbi:MAG: SufD family Fe-S cluster assembly protein, partial [Pedobacter sp.]